MQNSLLLIGKRTYDTLSPVIKTQFVFSSDSGIVAVLTIFLVKSAVQQLKLEPALEAKQKSVRDAAFRPNFKQKARKAFSSISKC